MNKGIKQTIFSLVLLITGGLCNVIKPFPALHEIFAEETPNERREQLLSQVIALPTHTQSQLLNAVMVWDSSNPYVVETVRRLLNAKADPNYNQDQEEDIPLIQAAARDSLTLVRLLLDAGANPNVVEEQDDYGRTVTPLYYAISNKNKEMADALIQAGANVKFAQKRIDLDDRSFDDESREMLEEYRQQEREKEAALREEAEERGIPEVLEDLIIKY